MDWKLFLTVFGTVFVAELGDKTQLVTLGLAADSRNPRLTILLAASLALVLSVIVGVAAGALISRWIQPRTLSWIAGSAFIVIGVWTIVRA